ncbi:hypothetical protein CHS0354_037028 [Potamilus streckersoni]|uniref:Uncharacterized protein n=1 Tax=Potamilus streckersoni TaxID=2493646 RepID=A0AAE0VYD3_9BIVA|nr:hypothetical protein CHS0354_037028 [Potamilus streckersoni]
MYTQNYAFPSKTKSLQIFSTRCKNVQATKPAVDKTEPSRESQKIINQHQDETGKSVKYPVTRKALERLCDHLEDLIGDNINIAEVETSFKGFKKSYKIIINKPMEKLLEEAIKYILVREPREQIVVKLFVKFPHAVDPDKFSDTSLSMMPVVVNAASDIPDVSARLTQQLGWKIDGYTQSGSGWVLVEQKQYLIHAYKYDPMRACRFGVHPDVNKKTHC